jgi:phosphoribosylamine--glycine ligase
MEIVLLGHMGRDEAAADRLQDHKLHVLGQWENPGLVEKAERSGGQFHVIDSITNVELIADYVQSTKPDMFLTNFDDALGAGVVDAIKQRMIRGQMPEILIPCPDQETARVEWDKFYLREIIDEIDPKYNPINFMATDSVEVSDAIEEFSDGGIEVVIKPRNLTGGKGVKVMGKHFHTFMEAEGYAKQVLKDPNQTGVEIQQKLNGHEFTLQLMTDGATIIRPPATYDYPYREDGDSGPGTGGMGTFSMQAGEQLPFITNEDYEEAVTLMQKLLEKLKERNHDYKGVLYPTFFKTSKGLKIVEVNARGGDPELINILDLLEDDVDYGEVLRQIATGELDANSVRYKKLASAMIYLVSPDYGYKKGPAYTFNLNSNVVTANGAKIRFAAAERIGDNHYQTVGSSRTVGLSALGPTPWAARDIIHQAIANGFGHPLSLQYRSEIAQEVYIVSLGA